MNIVFYIEIGGGGDIEGGTRDVPSFGEREHALSFARLLDGTSYCPRFVVGPLIADHIRLAGFEPEVFRTPEVGVEIVRRIDPAMVVACELFNLSLESAAGLVALGIPMGTMDGTSIPVEINGDPFRTPELARSLVLPDHYHSFRPCPVNDIRQSAGSVHYWAPFSDATRVSKDDGRYRSLGLDPTRKTVMFAAAPWAVGGAIMQGIDGYYRDLVDCIVDGLEATGEPIDFAFVSMRSLAPMEYTVTRARGTVSTVYSDLLSYDTYDHLLRSCNMIISDNIIQTSLSKAVVMGTPHLVIQNLGPSRMPHRYNIFPLRVLFPTDREYAQTVEVAEYGDLSGIRDRIQRIVIQGFYDGDRRSRREEYVGRLSTLTSPGELLDRIMGSAGTARRTAMARREV